jgi:signal transduction histidine kinase/CheY-like chemotaxis protein
MITFPPLLRALARLALSLLLATGLVQTAQGEIVVGSAPSQDFTLHAEILRDDSGALDVDAVAKLSSGFHPAGPGDLQRHYDMHPYWLRATLRNGSDEKIERWLAVGHPRLESATLFQKGPNGWTGTESGLQVPLQHKPVATIGVIFPLHMAAGESREILLRLRSRTVLDLNASLWQPMALMQQNERRQLLIIAGFGGSLVIALISLAIYARLRERSYLYFCLLHLSAGLAELGREGLWERYLWPPEWALPLQAHTLATVIALLCLILIQRHFLELSKSYRGWDFAFVAIAASTVALTPLSYIRYDIWTSTMSVVFAATCILVLAVSAVSWRTGKTTAGYMALAYGIFWIVEGLREINNLGLVDFPLAKIISVNWALLVAAPMFFLALTEKSRKLHAQLLQSQHASQTKSNFLARVSHELHAPLNTIIGYARMLRRGSARLPLHEGTSDIERNGLRLLGMIDELLDQSRLESGQLRLQPQPLALTPWLCEMERAGKIQAEGAGNGFTLTCQGEFPAAVLLDGARLCQVVDNLVSNANRYTHQGRIELSIKASAAAQAGRVHLAFSVNDTGLGVESTDLKKIFEPFYQVQKTHNSGERRRAGIGLGLSITRDLVTLMGGELKVLSKPGEGSSFSFGLDCPLAVVPAGPLELAPLNPVCAPGLRVLLADDDPQALQLLEDTLDSLGCSVYSVSSGTDAIALLGHDARRWDLVMTDQVMADADGWAVLAFARQQCPGLPVVLVSGMLQQHPAHLPAELQFDAFLDKPVLLPELAAVLATLRPAQPPLARPDAEHLNSLLGLVRLGEVSAIEDWCAALQLSQVELSDYAQQVLKAAQQLDFAELELLTR